MKKGFTLIELLVVVLIIGILAAIALPMYTKTVEKTRLTEAITMASSLEKSMQRYIMETGASEDVGGKELADALDIDIAGGDWYQNDETYFAKHFYYQMYCTSTRCDINVYRYTGTPEGETDQYGFNINIYPSVNSMQDAHSGYDDGFNGNVYKECWSNDSKYNSLCANLKSNGYYDNAN